MALCETHMHWNGSIPNGTDRAKPAHSDAHVVGLALSQNPGAKGCHETLHTEHALPLIGAGGSPDGRLSASVHHG